MNAKDRKFLGKKRDLISLTKSNKSSKFKDSDQKADKKTLIKKPLKSKKKIKISKKSVQINAVKSDESLNNPKITNQTNQIKLRNKSEDIISNNKNPKFFSKSGKIEKDEFSYLLNNNQDEFLHLGIEINPIIETLKDGNINTINSDFTALTNDLFSSTKFENSKPFKMIDYILNSDPRYLTSVSDKETYEELKKTIYNKKTNATDYSQVVFKSLYQYFKTDFSFSYIYKIFEGCNELIEKFYYPDIEKISAADSFGGFFFDRKDKFTYQNYLVDKLKNNYNNDWMREINDKEMIKSLIYLCNKHMKQSFKNLNIKSETNFVSVLKENLKFLDNSENEMNQGENLLDNSTFKQVKKNILDNKKFSHLVKKKIKKLFSFKEFCNINEFDIGEINKLFVKILEFFMKLKEDDYEKILNKIKKIEKESDKEINLIHKKDSTSEEDNFINVKSFWIKFRIIFYLLTLGDSRIKTYITDECFWRLIIDFVKEKKMIAQLELKKAELSNNINFIKQRRG